MTSSLQSKSCPSAFAVDEMMYDETTVMDVTAMDGNGCPVDLSEFADDGTGPDLDGDGIADATANGLRPGYSAGYIAKAAHWTDTGKFELNSGINLIDAATGKMRLTLPPGNKVVPGIYLSELSIRNHKGQAVFRDRRYLQVIPPLEYNNHGPITIPEVRMAIMDFPCSNSMLEDYEFSAAEVMFALRRPIDLWNETTPIISFHTPATFPYRENWLQATIGFLFQALAAKQRRNELTFQADTITVKDNDKHTAYQDLGELKVREYKAWMKEIKINLNAQAGFFSLGSTYSR